MNVHSRGYQKPSIVVLDDAEAVATAAAVRFIEDCRRSIQDHNGFAVVLSGGSTPATTYKLLATPPYRNQVDWSAVRIFFGDERCVPPDHPDSNYRMAYDALLKHVPVSQENVHRFKGELEPQLSAELYEKELRETFIETAWPTFDLVLLGLGEDGHTASLFPGTNALQEQHSWAVANWVEKLGTFRVTLTLPALNNSQHTCFLVTGLDKAQIMSEIVEKRSQFPAQLIDPLEGKCEWLVDKAAASRLK